VDVRHVTHPSAANEEWVVIVAGEVQRAERVKRLRDDIGQLVAVAKEDAARVSVRIILALETLDKPTS
jgi:hypothetical protein